MADFLGKLAAEGESLPGLIPWVIHHRRLDRDPDEDREWLRRAGPFEISEGTLSQVKDEAAYWQRSAQASEAEAADLRERLEQSEELIGDLESLS